MKYQRAAFADSACAAGIESVCRCLATYKQGCLYEDSSIDVPPFSTLKLQFREVCAQTWHGARSHSRLLPTTHPPKQVDTAWNKKRPFYDGLNPSHLSLPRSSLSFPSLFKAGIAGFTRGHLSRSWVYGGYQFSLDVSLEQLLGILILYDYRVPCLLTTDWSYFR